MSSEDVPGPATYRDHLFSRTLHSDLFKHNLVTRDGRVKCSPADINKYRSGLQRIYAERTAALYRKRNELVNEAENIFKSDSPSQREKGRLREILDDLNLELINGGIQVSKDPLKVFRKYLGSSEPKLSICERKLFEEIKRKKILKKDLKTLDEWLEKISAPISKVENLRRIPSLTWEDFQKKHYARQKKRMDEMDRARHTFIKKFSNYNENAIRKLVAAKDSVEKQRIYRCSMQINDELFPKYTAADVAISASSYSRAEPNGNKRLNRKNKLMNSSEIETNKDTRKDKITNSETKSLDSLKITVESNGNNVKKIRQVNFTLNTPVTKKKGSVKKKKSLSSSETETNRDTTKDKISNSETKSSNSSNASMDRNKSNKSKVKSLDSLEITVDSNESKIKKIKPVTPVIGKKSVLKKKKSSSSYLKSPVDSTKNSVTKTKSLSCTSNTPGNRNKSCNNETNTLSSTSSSSVVRKESCKNNTKSSSSTLKTTADRNACRNAMAKSLVSSKAPAQRNLKMKSKSESSVVAETLEDMNESIRTRSDSLVSSGTLEDMNKGSKTSSESYVNSETAEDMNEISKSRSDSFVYSETPEDMNERNTSNTMSELIISLETSEDKNEGGKTSSESLVSSVTSEEMNEIRKRRSDSFVSPEIPEYINESSDTNLKSSTSSVVHSQETDDSEK